MERRVASDYPQELLDLFHEYQHGDINRRTFLDGAAKFAVGGLTVATIFESLSPNYAWAQQVAPDDKRIKVGYETVQSPEGNGSIKGYLARPSKSGKLPVVLVIHENRGLNPYIEDVARRLALQVFGELLFEFITHETARVVHQLAYCDVFRIWQTRKPWFTSEIFFNFVVERDLAMFDQLQSSCGGESLPTLPAGIRSPGVIGFLASRSENPTARPNDSPFASTTPSVAPGKLPALCHSSSFS